MSVQYEKTSAPRFVVENVDGVLQTSISARRSIFVMLFLTFWLCGWTVGGITAIGQLIAHFHLFLLAWLGGWILGETFVLLSLASMISGKEIIRPVGNDLEIRHQIFGLGKTRLYRGNQIRDLRLSPPLHPANMENGFSGPLGFGNRSGVMQFTYGARTIYFGSGLDPAEGRLIIDQLGKRLPGAVAGA